MIVYNPDWLKKLFIRQQAEEALHKNLLDKEEWEAVSNQYPLHFYMPNFFIRVGLFILTTVIFLFSFGILVLLFLNSIDNVAGGLAIFFALVSYAVLEYMIRVKKHLQSGVDDAILWVSAGSLFGGLSYLTSAGAIVNSLLVFIISLYCTLRFADRVMSMMGYIALIAIIFFSFLKLSNVGKTVIPFLVMAFSAIVYFVTERIKRVNTNQLYCNCLEVLSIAVLLGFYLGGNFYVVNELNNALFTLNGITDTTLPLGWLFWLFTALIPLIYLIGGIAKKDITLMRVSLLLIAVTICTVQYYHPVTTNEVLMTIVGAILILLSYILSRYLKNSPYGFTNLEPQTADAINKSTVESMIQAQTFTNQPVSTEGTNFGGGSFGGGGGSADF